MPSAVMSWNSERQAGRRIELMKPSWKGLILYEGRHTTISSSPIRSQCLQRKTEKNLNFYVALPFSLVLLSEKMGL